MRTKIYPLLSAFLICAFGAQSQVIINEFSAANMDGLTDGYGEHEDWIELYNAGNQTVNLAGYYLSEEIDNPGKWAFPAGASIAPGEHLIVFASDRDIFDGLNYHAGFKITQTQQEYILLSDPALNLLDAVQIEKPNQVNHSRGRVMDGASEWGIFLNPTPGAPNGNPFDEYAEKPFFNQPPGFYNAPVEVALSAPAGLTIRYTLDGSEPTINSPLFANPILISQTTVLKAKVFTNDSSVPASFTEANTYFINENHTVPVLSVAGTDLQQLFDGQQFDPRGSFEYFDKGELIDEAYGEFNKHGNDSWAYAQRGVDYITRDQMGYKSSIGHQIFPNKDRDNFQRLILKPAANDNYPFINGAHIRDAYVHTLSQRANMELDERTYEPCVVYLNGKYWGVYEIREKVDDPDFTRQYYDQGEKWLDFIKTWGGTWEEYGSRADWDDLHSFITSNNMADDANYTYVKERLNVLSLIDYMILNTHVVCMDWLNWNTAWWRGRKPDGEARTWRYALWDMDATFGHYVNYTGIPNTTPNADPCYAEDLPADFEGHGQLIKALMANEEFHSLYVNRYADMNNSFFTCDYMYALLDSLIGRIEPEMERQVNLWGGSLDGWKANVETLKDFIGSRCTVINEGIVDCYEVTGPYPVTVKIEPANSPNDVKVNTFVPGAYPFSGSYFAGTTLDFTAIPAPDWELDHWEVDTNSFAPNALAQAIQLSLADQGEVVTAVFRPTIPCAPAVNFAFDSTLSSIHVIWEGPSNTLSYEIGYRKTGSADEWETLSLTDPEHTIFGLDLCTEYDIRVRTICDFAVGSYQIFTKTTACLSGGEEAEEGVFEWSVFPNPFNEAFSVDFILAENSPVSLKVVNAAGQSVYSENLGSLPAGQHRWEFVGGEGLSSGVYFIWMQTERGVIMQRIAKE